MTKFAWNIDGGVLNWKNRGVEGLDWLTEINF